MVWSERDAVMARVTYENGTDGTRIFHPIPPVYDKNSEILILGSFPSVKSRETGFYYGNPHNRFWKTLALVYDKPVPRTILEKKAFLSEKHIALWDVVGSCSIVNSSDSSIRDVVPNDLSVILKTAAIRQIYVNGHKAGELYSRYLENRTGMKAILLPSTSPANAFWKMEQLEASWRVIRNP